MILCFSNGVCLQMIFLKNIIFVKVANISVFRMKDTPELNFKLCWFTFTKSLVIWFAVFEKKKVNGDPD